VFSSSRLLPTIEESPLIRQVLLGRARVKIGVMNQRYANGSEVYIRAAYHSADPVRGIDGDLLLVDEFQDIASGNLPVLEETLSHSRLRRVVLTGTPKTVDNHLENYYRQSTAYEFQVSCRGCGAGIILDERCLGPLGLICPTCGATLDVKTGQWQARNPDSTDGPQEVAAVASPKHHAPDGESCGDGLRGSRGESATTGVKRAFACRPHSWRPDRQKERR
jgi:hypothetical protein